MERSGMKGRRFYIKKTMAVLLCGCMLAGTADVSVLAANGVGDGNGISLTGADTDQDVTPDEEQSFGAYAASETYFNRRPGKSVTMKVYAWSTEGKLEYIWYDPAGYEMTEESDTLNIKNLTDGEESDFGEYRCEVTDGQHSETIRFQVELDSTISVEYDGAARKQCYAGEPVKLAVLAKDLGDPAKELTYQWYCGKNLLEGENQTALNVPHTGKEGATVAYSCVVGNGDTSVIKEFQVETKKNEFSAELVTKEKHEADDKIYYYQCGSKHTWTVRLSDQNPYAKYTYKWYKKYKSGVNMLKETLTEETGNTCTIAIEEDDWCNPYEYGCEVSDGTTKVTVVGYVQPLEDPLDLVWSYGYAKLGAPAKIRKEFSVIEDIDKSTLSYQWYKKSGDILLEGQTSPVLSFDSVRQEDYGDYYCRIMWGDGKQKDSSATLEPYEYTLRQSAIAGYAGMDVTYTVGTCNTNEAHVLDPDSGAVFQWYEKVSYNEAKPINGANGRELTVTATEANQNYTYYCEVTYEGQTCRSEGSRKIGPLHEQDYTGYSVRGDDPVIYYDKAYWEPITLDPYLFLYENSPKPEIRWKKKVHGADNLGFTTEWQTLETTDPTYTLNPDELEYPEEQYRVIIDFWYESGGSATFTTDFYLRQEETLTSKAVTKSDSDGCIRAELGEDVTLEVEASSIQPAKDGGYVKPSYLWKKAVINEDGEVEYKKINGTRPTYPFSGIKEENYGTYVCEVTDTNETHSYTFVLAGYDLTNETPEQDISVYPGQKKVSLTADVTYGNKNVPLTYQWAKKGYQENGEEVLVPIEGAVAKALVFDTVTEDMAGVYCCTVSAGGKSTQVNYNVTTQDRFAVNGRTEGTYFCCAETGETVRLNVKADVPKGETVSYQWMKERKEEGAALVPIADAVAPTYDVTIEDASDYGVYICRITINGVQQELRAEIKDSDAGILKVSAEGSYSETKNKAYALGETAMLRAIAYCGSHELQYRWEKCVSSSGDYEQIEGAEGAAYQLLIKSEDTYGTYRCEVFCEKDDTRNYVYYNIIKSDDWDRPADTEQPADSQKPIDPAGSENPANTEQPTDTQKPTDSQNPEQPADSQKPVNTEQPADTQNPVNTESPADSQQPTDSQNPESTEQPADSQNPTDTQKPTDSQNPTSTEQPADSQKPIDPTGTENPVNTENPITPSDSTNPGSTENPSGSGQPSESDSQTPPAVSKKPATAVYLLPEKTMVKGTTYKLSATLTPSDSTDRITWMSSDQNVASVDETGSVKAVSSGTAQITAQAESGKKAVCKITVVDKASKATRVKLNKSKATMKAGDILQLKASLSPVKSTDALKWSSSNKKVASVDKNGTVMAKKAGKVKIKVTTDSGKSDTCTITVKQAAVSVRLNKSSVTVKVGKQVQLKAVMKPAKASDSLKWSSSNKKVAKVNNKGKVTGVKKGQATITVKTSGGKSAKCKVTVK